MRRVAHTVSVATRTVAMERTLSNEQQQHCSSSPRLQGHRSLRKGDTGNMTSLWKLLLWLLLFLPSASPCSDFLLNTSTSSVVSARTMDFTTDLRTAVEVIPRGTVFNEPPVFGCVDCPNSSWQVKYGFVALNVFGINFATDGLNEAGLSAGWLYLYETEYPTILDKSKPLVTSMCSYLLGNFASVAEVRDAIEQHTIELGEFDYRLEVPFANDPSIGRAHLHIALHDAHGKNLVIEFLHGNVTLYDNPNGVLTNDPPLEGQLAALRAINDSIPDNLPGNYGPQERFQRLSLLNRLQPSIIFQREMSYMISTDEQEIISRAVHLLQTVVLPPLDRMPTQWSVVRDHVRKKLYFQSFMNPLLRVVDLNAIDFGSRASRRLIPVTQGSWFVNETFALLDKANILKTLDIPPRHQVDALRKTLEGDNARQADKAMIDKWLTISKDTPSMRDHDHNQEDYQSKMFFRQPTKIVLGASWWLFALVFLFGCAVGGVAVFFLQKRNYRHHYYNRL